MKELFRTYLVIFIISLSILLAVSGEEFLSSIVGTSAFIVLYLAPGFARRIRQRHQQATQIIRDKEAGTIHALSNVEDYAAGKDRAQLFLYLRPFISTGILRVPYRIQYNKERASTGWSDAATSKTVTKVTLHWADLETILSMALEPKFRLIALGRPGEQVGAGRILSTDETWKENLLALARNAQGIFILASQREGTKWELDQIWQSEELLSKTIFLVPPVIDDLYAENYIFEYGAKENTLQLEDFRSSIMGYLSIVSKLGVDHLDKLLGKKLSLIKFSADGTIKFHESIPLSKPIIRQILFYIELFIAFYSERIRIRRLRKTIERAMRC